MNERFPNHEQRTHRPESYRSLGHAATAGAYELEDTQPQLLPRSGAVEIINGGAAQTNVDLDMIMRANHAHKDRLEAAKRYREHLEKTQETSAPQLGLNNLPRRHDGSRDYTHSSLGPKANEKPDWIR